MKPGNFHTKPTFLKHQSDSMTEIYECTYMYKILLLKQQFMFVLNKSGFSDNSTKHRTFLLNFEPTQSTVRVTIDMMENQWIKRTKLSFKQRQVFNILPSSERMY